MTPPLPAMRLQIAGRKAAVWAPPLLHIPSSSSADSWASSPVRRPGTAELREGIEQSLAHHFGGRRRITEIKRRLSPYRSSFNLEEIDVRLDDGTRVPIIFKDLSRQAMLKAARAARPEFLYQPR